MITQDRLLEIVIDEAYKFDLANGYIEDSYENSGNYFEITDAFYIRFKQSCGGDSLHLNYQVDMVVESSDPFDDWVYDSYTFKLDSMMVLQSEEVFIEAFKKALWITYNEWNDSDLDNRLDLLFLLPKKEKAKLKDVSQATIKVDFNKQEAWVLETYTGVVK